MYRFISVLLLSVAAVMLWVYIRAEPMTRDKVTTTRACDSNGNLLLVTGNLMIPVTTTRGVSHKCNR